MRNVSLLLQTMLVEHAPSVDGRTNEQERKAESTDVVGGQYPETDAEDDRTDARRELGQPQAVWLGNGHSRFP